MNTRLLAACLGACSLISLRADAQPTTPVELKQHTEAAATPAPIEDQTVVNLAAGATINAGNTESYAANAGGRFGLIRYPSQLTLEALATLGYAKNLDTGDVERTSGNVFGRGRYDLFLSRMDALFIAIQPRSDKYAGLNVRLQNQIGYLRNLYFPSDNHRLWAEAGYDLTYDNFATITQTTNTDVTADVMLPGAPAGATYTQTVTTKTNPGDDFIHSARLFLGYTNLLYAAANLNLGVETLFDVEDGKNVRVNGLAEFTSSVSKSFKLGVLSRVFFDNVPVEGVKKKTDAIIALQLVYTYDSLAEKAAAPSCPACDCTAQVAEATAACAKAAPVENTAPSELPAVPAEPSTPSVAPAPAPEQSAPAPAAPATP